MSAFGAKRTSRERSQRDDLTKMTPSGHEWAAFAAVRGALLHLCDRAVGNAYETTRGHESRAWTACLTARLAAGQSPFRPRIAPRRPLLGQCDAIATGRYISPATYRGRGIVCCVLSRS